MKNNKLVSCDHCGKCVPKTEAHRTAWEIFDLEWHYCNSCETKVFSKK